jgi:CRP/FNR family cyclic AMP-dependent transcriptional regulator
VRTVKFGAGVTIIREGEPGATAYLINHGSVKVLIATAAGEKRVATLEAGEVFGEMSLLEPGPRSATIMTVTDTECTETSYDEFLTLLQDQPGQAIVFMQALVRRLRQTNEMLAKLDPKKRGLRGLLADMRQSMALESTDLSDDAPPPPYMMW